MERLPKPRLARLAAGISGPKRIRGETLIGLLLALGLTMALAAAALRVAQRQAEYRDAQTGAVQLSQAADALRRFIAMVPANPTWVPAGPPVVRTGVDWLKPPSCGGPATNPVEGFLPCSAGDGFWAPQFQTTVTNVSGRVEARLTFVVPAVYYEHGRNATVADILAEHANAHLTTLAVNAPAPGVITPGFVTVFSNVRATDNDLSNRLGIMASVRTTTPSPDAGRVLMSVSNDASTDAYLRTDGANQMRANLNVGNNDVVNVNRVSMRPGAVATAVLGATCTTAGDVATSAAGVLLTCTSGRWLTAGTQPVATHGQACTRPGSYGELITDGTGMICQAGQWMPLQARIGGIVFMSSHLVENTSRVRIPDCAVLGGNGSPRIFLVPRTWYDGSITATGGGPPPTITISPTNDAWHFSATQSGVEWIVNIQASRGAPQSRAIAKVACVFP